METPKILPAGAGEKTQYLAHEFNDNTIRFLLHYPAAVEAGALYAATAALAASVDVLHASFVAGNLSAHWHVNRDWTPDDCFTLEEPADGDLWSAAHAAATRPIATDGKVQLHCTLVRGAGESVVVLTVSHLCVDGGDGKYLLNKLAEAYEMIRTTGSVGALQVKNGSRATEQMYETVDLKDFPQLLKNPISSVKTAFPYPNGEPGKPRLLVQTVDRGTMDAARRRGKAEAGATANDLLLAACCRAYAALPGVDAAAPMSIMSMMDLRRHCEEGESEGLSNLSGTLPTTLKNGVGSFEEVLAELTAQTAAAKANPLAGLEGLPLVHGATHTTPMGLLMMVSNKIYGSMSIGLTNLGNIPCAPLALGGVAPDAGQFGGPLKRKPAMQVSAASFDGTAALAVANYATEEDAALLARMLQGVADELRAYAAGA